MTHSRLHSPNKDFSTLYRTNSEFRVFNFSSYIYVNIYSVCDNLQKWQPNGLTGSLEFNNDGCRKNYVIDVIRLAKDGSLIQVNIFLANMCDY